MFFCRKKTRVVEKKNEWMDDDEPEKWEKWDSGFLFRVRSHWLTSSTTTTHLSSSRWRLLSSSWTIYVWYRTIPYCTIPYSAEDERGLSLFLAFPAEANGRVGTWRGESHCLRKRALQWLEVAPPPSRDFLKRYHLLWEQKALTMAHQPTIVRS